MDSEHPDGTPMISPLRLHVSIHVRKFRLHVSIQVFKTTRTGRCLRIALKILLAASVSRTASCMCARLYTMLVASSPSHTTSSPSEASTDPGRPFRLPSRAWPDTECTLVILESDARRHGVRRSTRIVASRPMCRGHFLMYGYKLVCTLWDLNPYSVGRKS